MSLLVDTGVFYAHHDEDSGRHDDARAALTKVLEGRFGQPYVTDYIYDETVTLTRYRMDSVEEAKTVSDRILETGLFSMAWVREDVFKDALVVFEEYSDQSLSFTDATTVAVAESRGIDYVLSFDDDFDGVVERVDPSSVRE
jgi:predicted nucleic acid-binding protein